MNYHEPSKFQQTSVTIHRKRMEPPKFRDHVKNFVCAMFIGYCAYHLAKVIDDSKLQWGWIDHTVVVTFGWLGVLGLVLGAFDFLYSE